RKRSVLCVIPATQAFFTAAQPFESAALVGVVLPWDRGKAAERAPDRTPDLVLCDPAVVDDALLAKLKSAQQLVFPFASIVADAAVDLIAHLARREPVAMLGTDEGGALIARRLLERGVAIVADDPGPGKTRVVVTAVLDAETLGRLGARQVVVLYGPGRAGERDAVGKA